MKRWFLLLVSCLVCIASHATNCEDDMTIKFEQTWKEYYASALVTDAKTMEKYFNFPLKLQGVYDDDKPTPITKIFFLKNYSLIFIKNKITKNTAFFTNFEKLKSEALNDSDVARIKRFCSGDHPTPPSIRFGDIVFKWSPKSGWKISEIFYNPDDKNDLFDSVRNPDLEYTFP